MKILITGGCRSGKSRLAQSLAESISPQRWYLATAEAFDDEMEDRIKRHRSDRDDTWSTIEEPINIAQHFNQPGVVLVDCLTLWLSNQLMKTTEDSEIEKAIDELVEAYSRSNGPLIMVTNEVGLGIVPMNSLARQFRDHAGRLAQKIALHSQHVAFCAAGIPLWIKGNPNVENLL
ncbi:MAG: bifunctional adenosylcobinamide kinase/adenosylcobinamide-phosphate guanylyltransferase [Myxococcota bacterium]|nr:bifunctional adenosylcobinamide kinase/adenosylcobinamide-phosphate guanylyltransferase [Myxococcota bacterium]